MKHITLIAGARPNFMKIAPLIHAIKKAQSEGVDIAYRLVHCNWSVTIRLHRLVKPNPRVSMYRHWYDNCHVNHLFE